MIEENARFAVQFFITKRTVYRKWKYKDKYKLFKFDSLNICSACKKDLKTTLIWVWNLLGAGAKFQYFIFRHNWSQNSWIKFDLHTSLDSWRYVGFEQCSPYCWTWKSRICGSNRSQVQPNIFSNLNFLRLCIMDLNFPLFLDLQIHLKCFLLIKSGLKSERILHD